MTTTLRSGYGAAVRVGRGDGQRGAVGVPVLLWPAAETSERGGVHRGGGRVHPGGEEPVGVCSFISI